MRALDPSMSDDTTLGYVEGHAPTDADTHYANMYARQRHKKEICLKFPEKYTWLPSLGCGYPCPEGLDCPCGQCVFTDTGCRQESKFPYYDCKKRKVACDVTSDHGARRADCEVCDYEPYLTKIQSHAFYGPYPDRSGDEEEDTWTYVLPPGCNPGDAVAPDPKYTDPKQCGETNSCLRCRGGPPFKYTMYATADGARVPCNNDGDCAAIPGRCSVSGEHSDFRTNGYCLALRPEAYYATHFTESGTGATVPCDRTCFDDLKGRCSPEAVCMVKSGESSKYVDYVDGANNSRSCAANSDCADIDGVCSGVCQTSVTCKPDKDTEYYSKDCDASLGGWCSSNDTKTAGFCFSPVKQPYYFDGAPAVCTTSADCNNFLGGSCSAPAPAPASATDPAKAVKGVCVQTSNFVNSRKQMQVWEGGETRDRCMVDIPEFKKFCTMPWTRSNSDGSEDDQSKSLGENVATGWKSRWRPPFFYNEDDGTCLVTKEYCTASVNKGGGLGAGFGDAKSYGLLLNDCKNPDGHSNSVHTGYDCCTPIGLSLAQFFFGHALTADLKDLTTGNINFVQFAAASSDNRALLEYFSDARLKQNVTLRARDYFGSGVHLYGFEWNETAERLYGLRGPDQGALAQEVWERDPGLVVVNEHGFLKIRLKDCCVVK